VVETYDRSRLIDRVISNLTTKLLLECLVVLLVCIAFLRHLGSGLVVIAVLLLGILAAFTIMRGQGIDANVMSLGGIAIAVGTMVDAAIVMIENVHKRLESAGATSSEPSRKSIVADACVEVGPTLFLALLMIGISFVPVLAFEAQERRLFAPLAYTKTYAVFGAALLSITLVPALLTLFARGRLRPENEAWLNRSAAAAYRPLLAFGLRRPRAVAFGALAAVLVSLWPATRLGTEFMPELDEGDVLYMPVTLPGISIDAVRSLLQQSDRAIREIPEVVRVFGKAGRAETATDPAPLEMIEAVVQLKPRDEWRPGLTPEALEVELDQHARFPGVTNSWLPPIKARLEMAATGTRTELGIGVTGPELAEVERLGERVEAIVREIPGVESAYSERVASGRYIDIDVDRAAAARYGLNIDDVNEVVRYAIGGAAVGQTIEGRERYPISLRYPQEFRDSLERLRALPLVTPSAAANVVLGDVAELRIVDGPAQIRSEDARPVGWVLISPEPGKLRRVATEARLRLASELALPTGYSLSWSGQYQYLERALAKLAYVVPLVLIAIAALLYLAFRRLGDVLIILGALPVALVGGVWLLWLLGYDLSIGVAVGFIALAGVAAETGIVMLLYLNGAWERRLAAGRTTRGDLLDAITEGALLRLRPKLMTVATITLSLLPIMFGHAAGSEVMQRIAAPIVGGMVSATLLTLLVVPALFLLAHGREVQPVPSP
jgi:Cu(I)/Ag(I) efflux system membrane protein CusA/SilA